MDLKVLLFVFSLIYCANSQSTQSSGDTLREELIKRADELEGRAKAEIVKLQVDKREHLAHVLSQESWKVKMVANELRGSNPDPVRLAQLEEELIHLEYNIMKELNILERESLTQEELLSNAKVLKKWVQEESKKLESQNNEHAHQAILTLQREVSRLDHLISELSKAQTQHSIERTEVEIRAIELRIFETLRHLGFKQNTSTTSRPTTVLATSRPGFSTSRVSVSAH